MLSYIDAIIYNTTAYPIMLVALALVGLFLSIFSRVPILLRCFYLALMVLCAPYGFLVWFSSITADLYDNPIHKLDLFLTFIVNLITPCVIFSYSRQFKSFYCNSNVWLYSPLIVLIGSLGCTVFLILTQ